MNRLSLDEFAAEGKRIAQEMGGEVVYNGPQDIGGIPIYHTFTDQSTGSTFAGLGVLDSKAALMALRLTWKFPLLNFPDVPDPIGTVKKMREEISRRMDEVFGSD